MSSQDIQIVAEIINGILNPDNAMRNAAVEKLELLRQNTPHLILCLFQIMKGTTLIFVSFNFFKLQFFHLKNLIINI